MARILVVDDNQPVRLLVRTLLERAGHVVLESADGADGLRRLYADAPDLVVLDLEMPRLDGFAALDRIRAITKVPVLICSGSRGDEHLRALGDGADDYLAKPFDGRELIARVDALLRRSTDAAPQTVDGDGMVRVDWARHEAMVGDLRLELTPLELRLLGTLVRHDGIALSHDQLLELVWNDTMGSREQVKAAVLGLRRKLRTQAPVAEPAVETVRGVGYRWRTPAA